MLFATLLLAEGLTMDFDVAVSEAIELFAEKRELPQRRRREVEEAFQGFRWVFTPELALKLALKYRKGAPQSLQSLPSLPPDEPEALPPRARLRGMLQPPPLPKPVEPAEPAEPAQPRDNSRRRTEQSAQGQPADSRHRSQQSKQSVQSQEGEGQEWRESPWKKATWEQESWEGTAWGEESWWQKPWQASSWWEPAAPVPVPPDAPPPAHLLNKRDRNDEESSEGAAWAGKGAWWEPGQASSSREPAGPAPVPPDAPPPAHLITKRARTEESSKTAQKTNDWTCRVCGNVNCFRRGYCIGGRGQCLTPREPSWQPGDWFCVRGNHNLARRTTCNRTICSLPRADGEVPRF